MGGGKTLRGPKGDGFSFTSDGNFDINHKRLCNVLDPLGDKDAVNLSTLKAYADNTIAKNAKGYYDAKEAVIENVGDAKSDSDVVNLKTLKGVALIKSNDANAFDVKKLALTNLPPPSHEADAVNLKYFRNHALLFNKATKEYDAKNNRITNLATPIKLNDAVSYKYFMGVLTELTYALYRKFNKSTNKMSKAEWSTRLMRSDVGWEDLFDNTVTESPSMHVRGGT